MGVAQQQEILCAEEHQHQYMVVCSLYHVYVLARLEGREREDTVFWHYFVLFLKSLLNARAKAGMDINISLRNGMFASRDTCHAFGLHQEFECQMPVDVCGPTEGV